MRATCIKPASPLAQNAFSPNQSGKLGTVFVKDGKEYRIPDKCVQSRQAYLSGLSFQGRIPQYKLRPTEGSLFDEPIALRTGEFREICASCGSRLTCNGCSNCGACES